MREDRKTIAFLPEPAKGPLLASVGIAQAVRERGHRPVFLADPADEPLLADYGFETFALDLGEGRGDGRAEKAPVPGASAEEELSAYVAARWEASVAAAERAEALLPEVLHKAQPDVICLDRPIVFPAVKRFRVPWVRFFSGAETLLEDPAIPPHLSGCGAADRACFAAFRAGFAAAAAPVRARLDAFLAGCGEPAWPPGRLFETSPWLNLLNYPEPLRWARQEPLDPARFQYLEGCVREDPDYEVPPFILNRDKPLLYVVLGAFGSRDVALVKRLIATLGRLPYRALVAVGEKAAHYEEAEIPPNVLIEPWVPQPSLLPQVDAVIHHGGNATFTECLFFGKPALILPYAWDGRDNAVRAEETGHGLTLDRYDWSEADLSEKLAALLEDEALRARLDATAAAMQAADGRRKAAGLLDRLARGEVAGATAVPAP